MYSKDTNYFNKLVSDEITNLPVKTKIEILGEWGKQSVNKVLLTTFNAVKNSDLSILFDNGKVALNLGSMGVGFVSYGLIVKTYMKHVHNSPYPSFLSDFDKKVELKFRRRQTISCFFTNRCSINFFRYNKCNSNSE